MFCRLRGLGLRCRLPEVFQGVPADGLVAVIERFDVTLGRSCERSRLRIGPNQSDHPFAAFDAIERLDNGCLRADKSRADRAGSDDSHTLAGAKRGHHAAT